MKKVFLFAYTRRNLGDDLFLKILLEKYTNVQFYINIPNIQDREPFEKFNNISYIENVHMKKNYKMIEINEYDAFLYIGGSVFIEDKWDIEIFNQLSEFIEKCKMANKPFFYISSNFGPYNTKKYLDISHKLIGNCKDVCFRDKYSYELFSNLDNVRYEPDLVFGYNINLNNIKKDTVGISVIDFKVRKELQEVEDKYYGFLINNIKKYIQKGKDIFLFSFCEYEGDEFGIKKILQKMTEQELDKIKIIKYKGNIENFIEEYKKMEYMICTKFHSLILSLLCEQKIYCLSYSKKINNIIEDLQLDILIKNIIDIKEMNEIVTLDKFNSIDKTILTNCIEKAKNQFNEFDKFIKAKN